MCSFLQSTVLRGIEELENNKLLYARAWSLVKSGNCKMRRSLIFVAALFALGYGALTCKSSMIGFYIEKTYLCDTKIIIL